MNTYDIYLTLLNSDRPELADRLLDITRKCHDLRKISFELLERNAHDLVDATDLL